MTPIKPSKPLPKRWEDCTPELFLEWLNYYLAEAGAPLATMASPEPQEDTDTETITTVFRPVERKEPPESSES